MLYAHRLGAGVVNYGPVKAHAPIRAEAGYGTAEAAGVGAMV